MEQWNVGIMGNDAKKNTGDRIQKTESNRMKGKGETRC
jgi:hypothetical protein